MHSLDTSRENRRRESPQAWLKNRRAIRCALRVNQQTLRNCVLSMTLRANYRQRHGSEASSPRKTMLKRLLLWASTGLLQQLILMPTHGTPSPANSQKLYAQLGRRRPLHLLNKLLRAEREERKEEKRKRKRHQRSLPPRSKHLQLQLKMILMMTSSVMTQQQMLPPQNQ